MGYSQLVLWYVWKVWYSIIELPYSAALKWDNAPYHRLIRLDYTTRKRNFNIMACFFALNKWRWQTVTRKNVRFVINACDTMQIPRQKYNTILMACSKEVWLLECCPGWHNYPSATHVSKLHLFLFIKVLLPGNLSEIPYLSWEFVDSSRNPIKPRLDDFIITHLSLERGSEPTNSNIFLPTSVLDITTTRKEITKIRRIWMISNHSLIPSHYLYLFILREAGRVMWVRKKSCQNSGTRRRRQIAIRTIHKTRSHPSVACHKYLGGDDARRFSCLIKGRI